MKSVSAKKYTGSCLCGDVSYSISGPPLIVAQCHCSDCQKSSGTGHTIGAMFQSDELMVNGNLTEYSHGSIKYSKVTKSFCAKCGTHLFGRNTRIPNHVTIPLGIIDESSGMEVEVVIFARDKPHWDTLKNNVSVYETQPDWNPSDS